MPLLWKLPDKSLDHEMGLVIATFLVGKQYPDRFYASIVKVFKCKDVERFIRWGTRNKIFITSVSKENVLPYIGTRVAALDLHGLSHEERKRLVAEVMQLSSLKEATP